MIEWIFGIVMFIIIVAVCCSGDGNSTPKRKPETSYNCTDDYDYSYCECPSCGAPYYDGYCEECGYPDINQGWIGENY